MQLRDDPVASSEMAAALTQSNGSKLTSALGRRPTDAELYMAHFMGADGAAKLISAAQDNPRASGAQMFPSAAAANHSIFYDTSGHERSISGVYSVLSSRYAVAANSSATQSALASAGGASSSATTVAGTDPTSALLGKASFLSQMPDVGAPAPAVSSSASANPAPSDTTGFHSLYQASDRPQPVSTTVRRLWGAPDAADASAATSDGSPPHPLDLFSDRKGAYSS
jgi:hypothetical protein